MNSVRAAVAVRTRGGLPCPDPADVARLVRSDRFLLGAVVSGVAGSFSWSFRDAARFALSALEHHWRASTTAGAQDGVRAALLEAIARMRIDFGAFARRSTTYVDGEDDDRPDATLIAFAIDLDAPETAELAWMGGHVAVVARRGCVAFATTPHTLLEQLRRESPALAASSNVPDVLVRSLEEPTPKPPETASIRLDVDDTLLLLSRTPHRGPCVSTSTAAALCASLDEPTSIAERLAEHGVESEDARDAVVVALRRTVESP